MSLQWIILASVFFTFGCAPTETKTSYDSELAPVGINEVVFRIHPDFSKIAPRCVAILPFKAEESVGMDFLGGRGIDLFRRAIYGQISVNGMRDIELQRIDVLTPTIDADTREELIKVSEKLNCDGMLTGMVTEMSARSLGFYSKISVGARLKLVRAIDGLVLWEVEHTSHSHGGELPLSLAGLAVGLIDAAMNMQDHRLLRTIDDAARRMIATVPDVNLQYDTTDLVPLPAPAQSMQQEGPNEPQKEWPNEAERLLENGDYEAVLELVESVPPDTGGQNDERAVLFIKGRVLLKLGRPAEAERFLLKLVGNDQPQAEYFNALGLAFSFQGKDALAHASYLKAIEQDAGNPFAHFNIGVTRFNSGEFNDAARSFFEASKNYLGRKQLGPALKAVAGLRQSVERGADFDGELSELFEALNALTVNGQMQK